MKKNLWTIFAVMLSTALMAQVSSNTPVADPAAAPAITAPAPAAEKETAPAAKAEKKKNTPKKKAPAAKPATPAAQLKTVPLVPGPATVVASNVNVRGQARLKSEVVTRLTKGETVMVLEEIILKNSGPDEPSAWAKIALPAKAHVWVSQSYVDAGTKTVKPRKLNVRSGPGENYSVLGVLARNDVVKEIGTKGEWLELEAPTNAYAFMAAQYLRQEATTPPTVAAVTPPDTQPAAEPANVTEPPTVAAPPSAAPEITNAVPEVAGTTNPPVEIAAAGTNATTEITDTNAAPVIEEPPPPRIVQREGIVRGTTSIQAPTKFMLISPETFRQIDYLYTTSPELDLSRYKGLRIIVTGEEALEARWGNTPVLTIQRIQVIE